MLLLLLLSLLRILVLKKKTILHSSTLIEALSVLAEDKLSKGFLGKIGIGSKSAFSVQFRLLVRAIATFLSKQLNPNGNLRAMAIADAKSPSPSGTSASGSASASASASSALQSRQTERLMAAFKALYKNKEYTPFMSALDLTSSYLADDSKGLDAVCALLAGLVRELMSSFNYLTVVAHL